MVLLTIVGITKTKGEVKEVWGVIAVSESSAKNNDHTGAGILLTICSAFICRGQTSGRFYDKRYRGTN